MNKKYVTVLLIVIGVIGVSVLSITALKSFVFSANSLGELFTASNIISPKTPTAVYPTLGVMIENELLSRPFQKGLSDADIVYEAPTEGGITRFLAVFVGGPLPIKMGPVRSARTYFLDWIEEYKDAMYTHVGGNADVLQRLRKESVRNVDEFFDGGTFQRENTTKTLREHTAFTTGEKLMQLAEKNGWVSFGDQPTAQNSLQKMTAAKLPLHPVKKIILNFSTKTYRVTYQYDPGEKVFLRFQAGLAHIDHNTKKQIFAKTVVIQQVTARDNGDKEGSISIQTVGSGKATVFVNDEAIPATWKKSSLNAPTQFFDKDLNPIPLTNPTWIEVLPSSNTSSYE